MGDFISLTYYCIETIPNISQDRPWIAKLKEIKYEFYLRSFHKASV